jgi:hypothetical protein
MSGERIAAVVLLALLAAALLWGRARRRAPGRAETVCGSPWAGGADLYAPSCGAQAGCRASCSGPTSGEMPAIDLEGGPLTAECCGRLGVPP